jgi:hypothetical protein
MPHPRFATLSAFVDGTLSPGRGSRVAAHVAGCVRCQGALADVRALSAAAAALPEAMLPEDGLARVLARRAAGERAILPVEDAPVPYDAPARLGAGRPWLRAAAGLVLLIAAAAGLMQLTAPRLEAVASQMQMAPAAPRAGEAIQLAYTRGSGFAGARELVVRAHLRHPGERAYLQTSTVVVLDTLRPDGDGVFRGEIRIPGEAVYAALTVETPDGMEVDANGRSHWEVLVHDSAGRPLRDALEQKSQELTGRDWEGAFAAARERVRLYPDDPESWSSVSFFERVLRGAAAKDSLDSIHRARFAALDSALWSRMDVDGAQMGAMYFYASSLEDSIAADRWDQRLRTEHPRHPEAVQLRAIHIMRTRYPDSVAMLRGLDSLWDEVGPAHDQLVQQGLAAARRVRDPEAIRRWVARYLRMNPRSAGGVAALALADDPALRPYAMQLLRAELARLQSPDDRQRFGITRAEFRTVRDGGAARVLSVLGRLLLADGQARAALDTLSLASEAPAVWDANVFLLAGRARLQAGDTAGAVRLLARVAVDPGVDAARRDSLAAQGAASVGAAGWNAALETARGEMRDRVLARSVQRPVPRRARLVSPGGAVVPLSDVIGEGAAVVVFWSRHCGPALEAVEGINRLAATLRAGGVRLVVMTEEGPSAAFAADVRELGLAVPIHHDTRREAAHGFRSSGTPGYFVLDSEGRIRFEYTALADIPRQLAVLR